ncbi:MAG: site-specific integrase [Candidatus Thiodiazotropha endolucinida]
MTIQLWDSSGEDPNPALWRGNLDMVLSKPTKVKNQTHYNALPYSEMPEFWAILSTYQSLTAKALMFTILTTARTGEVIAAKWQEIDFEAARWTVPKDRMKAEKEHRVPLVPATLKLLQTIPQIDKSPYLFPGLRGNPHISNMSMLKFLQKDMQRPDITVHGFRSTFKDWAVEETSFPGEISEAQLAHTIKNKAQSAYERGDKLKRRQDLLIEWAEYLQGATKAIPIRSLGDG